MNWDLFSYGAVETPMESGQAGQVYEEDDAEEEGDDAHVLGYG